MVNTSLVSSAAMKKSFSNNKEGPMKKAVKYFWIYQIENLTEMEITVQEGVGRRTFLRLFGRQKTFVNFLKTRV